VTIVLMKLAPRSQVKAERHVREAAAQGANIILLQELFGAACIVNCNCYPAPALLWSCRIHCRVAEGVMLEIALHAERQPLHSEAKGAW